MDDSYSVTIGRADAAAVAGSTINVAPGTYNVTAQAGDAAGTVTSTPRPGTVHRFTELAR